jgi:hypothetical protein
MAQNNTVPTKSTGDTHLASEVNEIASFQNEPVQKLSGTLDDSDITVDGSKRYASIKTVATATHSITIAASGHEEGNYIKQRYAFTQSCTITINNSDTVGDNTGTISPIPAGTYDIYYQSHEFGVSVIIPGNNDTQQDQLDPVTNFNFIAGDTQNIGSFTPASQATSYSIDFYPSTDVGNWQSLPGYNGTDTTNIIHSSLTNGVTYTYRITSRASGYLQSNYVFSFATPSGAAFHPTNLSPDYYNESLVIFNGSNFIDTGITNSPLTETYSHIYWKLAPNDGHPATLQMLWGVDDSGVADNDSFTRAYLTTSGEVNVNLTGVQDTTATPVFTDGTNNYQVVHWAINGTSVELYVNGSLQDTLTVGTPLEVGAFNIFYGTFNIDGAADVRYFRGDSKAFFVWGGASDLTAQNKSDLDEYFSVL